MGRSPVNRLHSGFLAGLMLATGLCARASRADGDAPASACPRPADVVAGLGQVLTTKPGEISPADILIHDRGTSWDIEVRGRVAAYEDPIRDCAERARVATVFAALVLEPFNADHGEEQAPAAAIQAQSSPRAPSYLVEVGPLIGFVTGARAHNTPLSFGGQVRGSFSGERFGISLGGEAAFTSRLHLDPYAAAFLRAALDLSPRLSWGFARFVLAAELGPYLGLLQARGFNLGENSSSNHFDFGARGAVLARLRGDRFSPFIALQAELGARRFDLMVDPSGPVGSAPRLWLGIVLGGALDFWR